MGPLLPISEVLIPLELSGGTQDNHENQKPLILVLLLVPRAPDSSRGMRTSLEVSRGTYKSILKFRLNLYKRFSLKLQYRTKKMFKKHICCCYC